PANGESKRLVRTKFPASRKTAYKNRLYEGQKVNKWRLTTLAFHPGWAGNAPLLGAYSFFGRWENSGCGDDGRPPSASSPSTRRSCQVDGRVSRSGQRRKLSQASSEVGRAFQLFSACAPHAAAGLSHDQGVANAGLGLVIHTVVATVDGPGVVGICG